MPLLPSQIIDKLKHRNPAFLKLESHHKKLLMHVDGIGVTEYLNKIQQFENSDQIRLREQYAKSNKSIFSSLLRPVDKIFTAKGGGRSYQVSSEVAEKQFKEKLSDITEDLSLPKWVQAYWKDKIVVDPNGLFLIENKDGEAYPTYKSIFSIYEYKLNGQSVDWVIFKPVEIARTNVNGVNKSIKVVRVYDNENDSLYKWDGNQLILIEDKTFTNPWKKVPAVIISNIVDTVTGYKETPIENEVELGDNYLLQASIKTIYQFKQGFPIIWMYKSACNICKGTGTYKDKSCKSCNGTGYSVQRDVSDIKLINPPLDNETPRLDPLAGFIQPDLETWVQMINELSLIRTAMEYGHWGTNLIREKEKTATEVWVNVQPVNERLNQYADGAELIETLLTDLLGQFYYPTQYKSASIHYGRRYLIETPDQLIKKYAEGKEKGLNETTLNYILIQYYQSEFANDFKGLDKNIKLLKIEPFIHHSISVVLGWNITPEDKKAKTYFNEWAKLQTENHINETDLDKLNKEFENFLKTIKNEGTNV